VGASRTAIRSGSAAHTGVSFEAVSLTAAPTGVSSKPVRLTAAQTHAWAKPCLAATTWTLTGRTTRFEGDHERTHGRSPVWRPELHTDAPLHRFRRRSRTLAWAKPCLAGRPTVFVRTQSPEQNTSRSRPSGMELPDYPVMVTLPTPQDQDGPALPLPAGSFRKSSTRAACPRLGEALFGGPTHGVRTNAVSRAAHLAWPPVWDGAS
jgi:hypothetical protein